MTETKPKYSHLMIFVCTGCKAEHRPKPGTWEAQSKEIGALGWRITFTEGKDQHYGYFLHCKKCAALLAAAAAT